MTTAALITQLLAQLRSGIYADRPREYFRDQRDLTKAIARYGQACTERGWEVDPGYILPALQQVIRTCAQSWDHARHFPVYLEGAIDRHVRLRAEEIRDEHQRAATAAAAVIGKLRAAGPPPPRPRACDTLALIYQDLAKHRRHRRPAPKRTAQLAFTDSVAHPSLALA